MLETADKYLRSDAWPVGTELLLLNVPWDEGYRDVVAWESAAARDAWFDAQTGEVYRSNRFNYLWPNQPIAVPVPYSSAYRYNYVAVTNPAHPVDDEGPVRTYYYFITAVDYLSPQASNLTVQLDVMTTYGPTVELGRAFVERGHIAMANENARGTVTGEKLRDYLSQPEGLDVGSTYLACHKEFVPLLAQESLPAKRDMLVIVSTADLTVEPGTVDKPSLRSASGATVDRLPSGCNVYAIDAAVFETFMMTASAYTWVMQCVVCIYSFPRKFLHLSGEPVAAFGIEALKVLYPLQTPSAVDPYDTEASLASLDAFAPLLSAYGDDVLKMLTYPYSVIELSAFEGKSVFLRPELVRGSTLALKAIWCSLMPFARVGVWPDGYAGDGGNAPTFSYVALNGYEDTRTIGAGDYLDSALWLNDFPQFSIVNNNYLTVLASSAYTRAYSYSAAGWGLERANAQALNAYENAMANADVYSANVQAQGEGAFRNALIGLIPGAASQAGTFSEVGAFMGMPSGAAHVDTSGVESAALGLLGGVANMAMTGSNLVTQATVAGNTLGGMRGQADRNKTLADMVNQGDYENRVAGIDAKVQDAALTPPSTVGQQGGNGFNWSNGLVGICVTWKVCAGAARAAVMDYFRRYGYAIRRFLPMGTVRHLLCMRHFAYWKVLETTVTAGYANESERQAIRGVFEKGVTLWDAPESIGTTNLSDNAPRSGYSY